MKSESPFQKMTFSAFLFLLKLSVSHNDHEMLSFIRNTLFTESLQIDFITRNSVVSCHPMPCSQTGLALNSACEYLRGQVLCSGSSGGTGCRWKEVGPWFGLFPASKARLRRKELWPWVAKSQLMGTCNLAACDFRRDVVNRAGVCEPRAWPGPEAGLGVSRCCSGKHRPFC